MEPNTTAYRLLHYWVEEQLGKPHFCIECGENNPSKSYDWSNVSGKYLRDTSDWIRLCHRCHCQKDFKKQICKNGHEMTEENTIIRSIKPGSLHRVCRQCKNAYNRKHRNANKEAINLNRRKPK